MTITRSEYAQLQAKASAPVVKRPAPSRKEREILRAILDAARSWKGVTLWRTNVGAVKDGTRFVRFGFPGLSDLIGWRREQCRACMKPERYRPADPAWYAAHPCSACGNCGYNARFVAVEVKRPGQFPTREQHAFLQAVNEAGGLAFVARCVEDARQWLGIP